MLALTTVIATIRKVHHKHSNENLDFTATSGHILPQHFYKLDLFDQRS